MDWVEQSRTSGAPTRIQSYFLLKYFFDYFDPKTRESGCARERFSPTQKRSTNTPVYTNINIVKGLIRKIGVR